MGKNLSELRILKTFGFFIILSIYSCKVALVDPLSQAPEISIGSVQVEGLTRTYLSYFPRGSKKVLFLLHGGGGSPESIAETSQMNSYAKELGFGVVYPKGYKNRWNDGRQIPHSETDRLKIPDVLFLKVLKREIVSHYGIPEENFHIAGYSNGGFMVLRTLCEEGDLFQTYSVVAAGISDPLSQNCPQPPPKRLLIIWSKDDPVVPYYGGEVILPNAPYPYGITLSYAETIEFFSQKYRCKSQETQKLYRGIFLSSIGEWEGRENCEGKGKIYGISLKKEGHAWPKEASKWIVDFIDEP